MKGKRLTASFTTDFAVVGRSPRPLRGLGVFVGAIKAFIVAMVTLVFAVVATSAHGHEEH